VKVAVPEGDRATVTLLPPSTVNVTDPVGVAVEGAFAVTTAVKVTDCPDALGLPDVLTVVVVGAELTVWVTVAALVA
jgi:hypothetical protein